MKPVIRKLDFETIVSLFNTLKETMVAGNTLIESKISPFISDKEKEVIVEDCISFGERIDQLKECLLKANVEKFYVLRMTNQKMKKSFFEEIFAYEIPRSIANEEFSRAGYELGFDTNGICVYYFDDTYTWCISKEIDLLYVSGSSDFINTFFTSYNDKIAEVKTFICSFEDGKSLDCPKEAKDAMRVIINDEICDDYDIIKKTLFPNWPDGCITSFG